MSALEENILIRELSGGLILRRSSPADAQKLSLFNSQLHGEDGPDEKVGQLTRDLLERPHPTFGAHDFTIIEEKTTGRIVSTLNLISQTWTYAGIPFGVGRPELVGTLPEYRQQGLVRLQFDEIHRWSAQRGQLAQAITGIPYFYRQFGYEMCVDLEGSRSGGEANLPRLPAGSSEPFTLRPACEADIPFLISVSDYASRRSLLSVPRDEALWKLDLSGRSEKNVSRLVWNIIERSPDAEPVGFLAHSWYCWKNFVPVFMYELKPGVSWLEVSPAVARWIWQLGQSICAAEGRICTAFKFGLGASHPVYEVLRESLPQVRETYAWYMRVPDLPAFIRRIAPVLAARLADSLIPGHTGELLLNFYHRGLRLGFEHGRLTRVDTWQPDSRHEGDAAFPDQTFLQVLFGHRSLEELHHVYTDCFWKNDAARVLVNTLFPRKPSHFIGVV